MRKYRYPILFFCFVLSLRAADLTVLATGDLHGAVGRGDQRIERLGAMIRQERARSPHTLLLDCGDTIHGSYEVQHSNGLLMIKVLNLLRYDVWLPGNHDFEYGIKPLQQCIKAFRGKTIGCEINIPGIQKWVLFELDGRRIAVTGVTDVSMRNRLSGKDKSIIEPYDMPLERAMRQIRATRPDMVILMLHNAFFFSGGSVAKIVHRYPFIDLVIGAHNHRGVQGQRAGRSLFVQAGSHASHLAVIDIGFSPDPVRKSHRIHSRLRRTDDFPDKDLELARTLEAPLRAARKWSNTPIGRTEETDASRLAVRSMKEASGADVAFFCQTGDPLPPDVCRRDLLRAFPYEERLMVMEVSLQEYQTILNEQKQAVKRNYRFVSEGRVPENKQSVRLALSSYVASGGGTLFPASGRIAERLKAEPGPLIRDLVRKWISARK